MPQFWLDINLDDPLVKNILIVADNTVIIAVVASVAILAAMAGMRTV